jgi:hypothetical protein
MKCILLCFRQGDAGRLCKESKFSFVQVYMLFYFGLSRGFKTSGFADSVIPAFVMVENKNRCWSELTDMITSLKIVTFLHLPSVAFCWPMWLQFIFVSAWLEQGCTNPGSQVVRAASFTLEPQTSVRDLRHETLVAPRIFKCLLDFWVISGTLD